MRRSRTGSRSSTPRCSSGQRRTRSSSPRCRRRPSSPSVRRKAAPFPYWHMPSYLTLLCAPRPAAEQLVNRGARTESFRAETKSVTDLMQEVNVALDKVCLLDPRATGEIAPQDGKEFEWFLCVSAFCFWFLGFRANRRYLAMPDRTPARFSGLRTRLGQDASGGGEYEALTFHGLQVRRHPWRRPSPR